VQLWVNGLLAVNRNVSGQLLMVCKNVETIHHGSRCPLVAGIRGLLEDVRNVARCRPTRFSGIPHQVPRARLMGVSCTLQIAPNAKVDRSEIR
jgi:hypothetical protein